MGTRNLTCVVLDGEFKVAQYCQWDGYPEGQGATVFEFLRHLTAPSLGDVESKKRLNAFREKVRGLRVATPEEVKAKWVECGAPEDSDWVDMGTSQKMKERYPHLHRDMGAAVLEAINDGKVDAVQLSKDFAGDSLFCEWCYVIDLDNEVLEVMRGFQTEPHEKGRFADMPVDGEPGASGKTYYPVALEQSWKFSELPESVEAFVATFATEDEEEEVEA